MYTVVVADDETELRRALIRKVNWESVGFRVVGEAENGVEALEMVEKYEPDLLLTDIRMPFVSGIELARQVREIRPMTQIAFLSGFDDFSYAQQAIQYNIISYMLKPISSAELTAELAIIKEKIDKKYNEFASPEMDQVDMSGFLMPLLLDSFQGEYDEAREQEILKDAVACGLLRDVQNEFKYTVMVTKVVGEDGKNCTTRKTVSGIDQILRKYIRHTSFFVGGRVVTLLIATSAGFDKYLHIIVDDISQSVRRIMDMSCEIGVSREEAHLSCIHDAYIDALNAINYSRKKGNSVHYIADVERIESIDLEQIQASLSDVETVFRGGSDAELEEYLNQIFDKIEEKHISPAAANFMLVQLVTEIFRIVYAVAENETIQKLQQYIPVQTQMINSDYSQTRKEYVTFCLKAKEFLSEQRKKSSSVICDKAMEIIHNRYADTDLSLVMVSNEICVSPNYLSSLMKKSTGSTFIDLLTAKRISKAKEYLQDSSMRIGEIAEACGYSDQHYFSYCFKKVTGESPNASRRKHEDE